MQTKEHLDPVALVAWLTAKRELPELAECLNAEEVVDHLVDRVRRFSNVYGVPVMVTRASRRY